MKKIRAVFFLLAVLHSGAVLPAAPDSCLDTIEISGLPYTITQSDTCYCLTDSLTANDNGITFSTNVHDTRLDILEYAIEFGANAGSYEYGIKTESGVHDVIIEGGTVYRQQGPTEAYGTNNHALWLASGTYSVLVENVRLITDGSDAHVAYVWEGAEARNIIFHGGSWRSNSEDFTSRHTWSGATGYFSNPPDPAPWQYNYIIDNVNIENGPCQGIGMNESSVFLIQNCTLSVDGYNTPPSSENANQYAIISRPGAGSLIRNNVVIAGTERSGCRGFLIENATGTAENHVVIRDNILHLWHGPDSDAPLQGDSTGGSLRGIRDRSIDGGTVSYVDIINNLIYAYADRDPSTTHIGSEVFPLSIKAYSSTGSPAHHIRVDSNTVYAIALDSGCLAAAAEIVAYGTVDTAGGSVTGNRFYCSNRALSLSDAGNGIGCRDWYFRNNIIGSIDATMTDSAFVNEFETWHVGVYAGDNIPTATGNVGIDNQFTGDADPTDVQFNPGSPGPSDLRQMRTIELYVAGAQGDSLPIQNAACSLWNSYGALVLTGTTDVNGKLTDLVSIYFNEESGQDSTFNDFTYKAAAGSKTETNSAFTVGFAEGQNVDTAWLDTLGGGYWEGNPGPAGPHRIRGIRP